LQCAWPRRPFDFLDSHLVEAPPRAVPLSEQLLRLQRAALEICNAI